MAFSILKKKKQESTLKPASGEKPPSMDELMPKPKGDIPPIENIPLPPKPEEEVSAPSSQEPTKEEKTEAPEIEEPMKEEAKEPEAAPETPPETGDLEPATDESLDFSLPDFDEEELKLEDKVPPVSEEPVKEEKEATEEPIGEVKEEVQKIEEEIKPLAKEELAPKIEPVFTKHETKEGEEFFMAGEECNKLFEIIELTEHELSKALETFTQNENANRNRIQLYKSFHDSLDIAQEKLMLIDNALFENR